MNTQTVWIDAQGNKPTPYHRVLLCFEKESKGMNEVIKTGVWCGDSFIADGGNPLLTDKVKCWSYFLTPSELKERDEKLLDDLSRQIATYAEIKEDYVPGATNEWQPRIDWDSVMKIKDKFIKSLSKK